MQNNFKCGFCSYCDGTGCIGQIPGMGGPNFSRNFLHNCADWDTLDFNQNDDVKKLDIPQIQLAPVTGAIENVGYYDEEKFYFDLLSHCLDLNVNLSIGDGTPDSKLLYGISAVKELQKKVPLKVSVFLKPYPQEKLLERLEWVLPVANCVGIDIDSYNIITMRNLVNLEKKSSSQLNEIKFFLEKKNIPFAIKGVFTEEDIDLVKEVKPSVAYISNHGGRVETQEGSTAYFLKNNYLTLLSNCDKLWVDGGLRTEEHFRKAASYGVSTVLMGRPFITSLCKKNI